MTGYYLDGSEPGVRDILTAAGYNGRKNISFKTAESVEIIGNYWDGGHRTRYVGVELNRPWQSSEIPSIYGAKFPPLPLRPGMAVVAVSEGAFYGATIYVHPDDSPKLITDSNDTITEQENIVLSYVAHLKNTYGGRKNIQFTEANRATEITQNEWTVAKNHLIKIKLLRKNGSITPAGRNQATFTVY
jgi:hypothetical protein